MDYFISCYNGFSVGSNTQKIVAGAKYKLEDISVGDCLTFNVGENVFTINCYDLLNKIDTDKNFLVSSVGCDRVLICCGCDGGFYESFSVKANKTEYHFSLGKSLKIFANNNLIYEGDIYGLTFEAVEEFCGYSVCYFSGVRKAVVVLKGNKVFVADYYDEHNSNLQTKLFMKKCGDTLNHGLVFKLTEKGFEQYVVYLDDGELKLKNDFLPCVFLDCLLVKDLTYCKHLLCDELKEKCVELQNFLLDFDKVIFYEKNLAILLKKNTLAGVFEFNIRNDKIENIVELNS